MSTPRNVPALLAANPQARVLVEPGVIEAVELARAEPLTADTSIELGGVKVAAVGGLHAVIHRDIPRIGNVGLVVSGEGEPTFFHPGDSLAEAPSGVDVLGVPAYGPVGSDEGDRRLRPRGGRSAGLPDPRRAAERARLGRWCSAGSPT